MFDLLYMFYNVKQVVEFKLIEEKVLNVVCCVCKFIVLIIYRFYKNVFYYKIVIILR